MDAARPTRGGWRGWLVRLMMAVQVLIVGAVVVAGVPMFGLMIAGAVNEQLLTSTGARTQTMVVDVHLLGVGALIDRVVTAMMGLLFLAFGLLMIGLGTQEAGTRLTAWRRAGAGASNV
jgi:hypothetical protein